MALRNKPVRVIGEEEDMAMDRMLGQMSYDMKVDIARTAHSQNYYDAYKEAGLEVPEDVVDRAVLTLMVRGFGEGKLDLNSTAQDFSSWFYEEKMPAIRQSNQRSIEWMLTKMENERPDLMDELAAKGCNFGLTEYQGTASFTQGTVQFIFKDMFGNPLMILYYNPSDMSYDEQWF